MIVTAGLARKPGMSRDDLIEINAKIIGKTRDQLFKNCLENVYKDKKRKDNNLRFILVKSLGSSEIVTDITKDSIAKVFEKIIK